MFIALIFAPFWVSHIVIRTRALPDLVGLTVFVAAPYGLGKAGETVTRVFQIKKEDSQSSVSGTPVR